MIFELLASSILGTASMIPYVTLAVGAITLPAALFYFWRKDQKETDAMNATDPQRPVIRLEDTPSYIRQDTQELDALGDPVGKPIDSAELLAKKKAEWMSYIATLQTHKAIDLEVTPIEAACSPTVPIEAEAQKEVAQTKETPKWPIPKNETFDGAIGGLLDKAFPGTAPATTTSPETEAAKAKREKAEAAKEFKKVPKLTPAEIRAGFEAKLAEITLKQANKQASKKRKY